MALAEQLEDTLIRLESACSATAFAGYQIVSRGAASAGADESIGGLREHWARRVERKNRTLAAKRALEAAQAAAAGGIPAPAAAMADAVIVPMNGAKRGRGQSSASVAPQRTEILFHSHFSALHGGRHSPLPTGGQSRRCRTHRRHVAARRPHLQPGDRDRRFAAPLVPQLLPAPKREPLVDAVRGRRGGGRGGDFSFSLTCVPEPGTWAAAALALGSLRWHQRQR